MKLACKQSDHRGLGRIGLPLAALSIAALAWLGPVRAQEHGTTAPAANAPAASEPGTGAPAANAPAETTTKAPETGETHQGPAEHGPAGSGTPAGGTHEAGERPDSHAAEGAHAPEGEHGAGGHEKKEEAFSLHNPTWISGILKQIWYRGPATLNADGALGEGGAAVTAAELQGKQLDYEYEDHHAHPPREYAIHPTIGQIGTTAQAAGAETKTITVDGRQVTLINPTVNFALEKAFPELLVISLLTALAIAVGGILLTRNLQRVPTRTQTVLEMLYERLDTDIRDLIGPHYKRYLPLVVTLFLYILIMNLAGLIPGWASPTANINVPAGLAIVIIAYVQYEGIRVNGLKGYLMHFVGDPWWLAPLNFPIHVIGELARVLSLTVRLFGNIFGEDVVIVILISLSIRFFMGAPGQFPMYFLAIFTSFVQAMVFSILTCVYLALMTSHEDHGEHHGSHGHEDDHGHIQEARAPAPAV
jgi:F-type H+-transporting ATPase subunit a